MSRNRQWRGRQRRRARSVRKQVDAIQLRIEHGLAGFIGTMPDPEIMMRRVEGIMATFAMPPVIEVEQVTFEGTMLNARLKIDWNRLPPAVASALCEALA